MTSIQTTLSAFLITAGVSLFSSLPAFAQTGSSDNDAATANHQGRPTTIYFLRNAESLHSSNDELCGARDCDERLSDKGLHRANLLAS